MNSEIIGISSNLPWAFVFTRVDQIPRHPAQLYEAFYYLCVFALLYFLWKYTRLKDFKGFIFGLGLFLIFSLRFMIEFLKVNQADFESGLAINMGQILSIPMILIGLIVMTISLKMPVEKSVSKLA